MNTRRIGSSRLVGKASSSEYSASSRRAHEADVLGRTVECIWFNFSAARSGLRQLRYPPERRRGR